MSPARVKTVGKRVAETPHARGDGEEVPEASQKQRRPAKSAPVIPGYRIEGILARGSSATVYRARQKAVDREVALKVLHPELAGRKRLVMRLQREARTTARLAHPHIVSAIDMGEVDGLWWFAMELVQGPSLALRLRQSGALSEREALRLFIPLCEALVHLSEQGVVHRDIKPANILIEDTGGARLADLGLAFSDGDPVLTAQGGTLGTPHYISPEQARDPSAVDGRADLWSFGATLYHALCGEPPFRGTSLAEVLAGVLHARIPDPSLVAPELSKGIVLVLRKCLSRDLETRYSGPGPLLLDMERVRERRAPHINPRALEPVERRSNGVLVSIVGSLVVVAALVLLWIFSGQQPPESLDSGAGHPEATIPLSVSSLIDRSQSDSSLLAAAINELGAYSESAPESLQRELVAVTSRLLSELRVELRGLQQDQEALLEELIAENRLVQARAAVDTGFEVGLKRRTGYSTTSLPHGLDRSRKSWLIERERELTQAMRVSLGVLVGLAEVQYERVLLPAIQGDIEAQAWRTARAKLGVTPLELVHASGATAEGIPPAQQAEAFAGLRSRLRVREDLLIDEWTRVEAGLHRWIERRATELESSLRSRRLRSGVASELMEAFDLKLEQDGLRRDEFLEPEGTAVLRELERRCLELSELERSILSDELMQRFQSLQDLYEPKWSAREYESLLALWKLEEQKLLELPDAQGTGWREEHLAEISLIVSQAELLLGLVQRAAGELELRAGQDLELSFNNIPVNGRLALIGDPLLTQFSLDTRQGLRRVDLRLLDSRDLLALAGTPDPEASSVSGEDRLTAALLYLRDGNVRRALTLVSAKSIPRLGESGRMARFIEDRSIESLQESHASSLERDTEAQALLDQIYGAAARPGQLSAVLRLLDEYGDSPLVRGRVRDLRKLRAELEKPAPPADEAAYRVAFDPLGVELSRDRVRLIFEFGPNAARSWERGDWEVDWDAWEAPSSKELTGLSLKGGPRLSLNQPLVQLDPSIDELSLRLDLELRESAHAVLSAAGFHVSVFAKGASQESSHGWLVTSGSLDQHFDALRRGKGELEPFLNAGEPLRLEFELRPRAGRVSLGFANGQQVSATVKAPRSSAEYSMIELRAEEGTRLRRTEIELRRP